MPTQHDAIIPPSSRMSPDVPQNKIKQFLDIEAQNSYVTIADQSAAAHNTYVSHDCQAVLGNGKQLFVSIFAALKLIKLFNYLKIPSSFT